MLQDFDFFVNRHPDMLLYIVRHAIAVPHGTPGCAEDDRPLTAEGIEKMQKAARGLRGLSIRPDLILTSPLPRALQTAHILLKTLDGEPPLETLASLSPGGNRRDVYRELQQKESLESIMLVGHQPSLGEIAGEIAWGSAENYVELKKGGACCLQLEKLRPTPSGTLLWLATPSILRSIANQ